MSGKKVFETKIQHDDNTDSGFLSGPISEQLTEDLDAEAEDVDARREDPEDRPQGSEKDKVSSEVVDLDSGLDLCLSECLDSLHVEEEVPTPTARLPTLTLTDANTDIPPLAILFQQDEDGDTQLHIAAVHGCEKSVGTLIRVCPGRYLLDLPNDFGHTALHLAVMSGHAVVARMLVHAGASLGVRDLNGDTPVHLATAAKNVECLQALLAPIGNQLAKRLASVLNLKNYDGQTCVHLAATAGHRPTMQTLLYYGADMNVREGMAGWTALHIAARRGDARLAQQLLQAGGASLRARDYAGRTPRRLAKRANAFTAEDKLRFLAALPDDSDTDSDSDDEGEAPPKRSRVETSGAGAGAARRAERTGPSAAETT